MKGDSDGPHHNQARPKAQRGNEMIDIDSRAKELAHENSPACRNRPSVYSNRGHGKSCQKLAKVISGAMREAIESIEILKK